MQLSFDIDVSLPETGAARAAAGEMDPAKTEIWLPSRTKLGTLM